MKNISIRHAHPDDSFDIARVQVETWYTAYRGIIPESYLDTLDIKKRGNKWHESIIKNPNQSLFVAIVDTDIVGFISGCSSREKIEYEGEITAFYVLDLYQGNGIGKMLFERMLEEFRQRNYPSFYLWALSMGPAIGFYEYMGGKYIDTKVEKKGEIEFTEVSYGWK